MSDLKIVLAHAGAREERTVTTGTKAWELYADDSSVIAARVGGVLRDLAYELQDGDEVEDVAIDSPDGRDILRHSTAHVMAQAVQQLFPDAKLGIGPPIENGFYYDFDVETPFNPDDLASIETAMRKIIKEGQRFSRRPVADGDALDELKDEPYKLELIGLKGSGHADEAAEGANVEVGGGELTIYDNLRRDGELAWKDLCRGPHLPTTKRIPAFKLMRSAAAYWRGNEKNKQLQRIYGTAWESKDALATYLHQLRGGREARPPQARSRARPVLLPGGARPRPRRLPSEGRRDPAGDGGLRPAAPPRGGLLLREHAQHQQGRAVPHLGPPALLRRHDVPADGARGREVPAQGDELPDAQPDLPVARPVLSRAAAAAVRVRQRLSLREVRRRGRPHPRARDDPGRLALLRDPRAGRRRGQEAAGVLPRPVPRLRARRLLSRALDARTTGTRRSSRAPTRTGRTRPRRCSRSPTSRASTWFRIPVARRSTGRRSRSRPRMRSAAPGSCRPCSTTSPSLRASAWSTSRPTARTSSR